MALSIIGYNPDPASRLIYQIEAASAEEMTKKLDAVLQEVIALNATIQDPFQKFQPADANLAGAGDGHTFIFTVTFVVAACNRVINVILAVAGGAANENTTLDGDALPIQAFVTRFFMASQAEALAPRMKAAADEIALGAGETGALVVWQQVAGASGGTRFMGGITGLNVVVPPPA